jgi:hypothetical protein
MAQQRWRRLNGAALLPLVRAGVKFVDGVQEQTRTTINLVLSQHSSDAFCNSPHHCPINAPAAAGVAARFALLNMDIISVGVPMSLHKPSSA